MVSLSNSTPNGKLTMMMVKDALFNEEDIWKETSMNQSLSLVIESKDRPQGNGKARSEGRNKRSLRHMEGPTTARTSRRVTLSVTIVAKRAT